MIISNWLDEEIPDEMTKSIAEEIHDVIMGVEVKPEELPDFQTKDLPFSYPFTLKHVGHLFDKSRHHFISSPRSV